MTHLIDKDALVAEIEKIIADETESIKSFEHSKNVSEVQCSNARISILMHIHSFIDTLEVKEVDLDNEYTEEVYSHLDSIKDTADRMTSGNFMHNKAAIKFSANTIAKVLELIGLKA